MRFVDDARDRHISYSGVLVRGEEKEYANVRTSVGKA